MTGRRMIRIWTWIIIAAGLILLSPAALAGDKEFDNVVKHVEEHYNAKRMHVPFLWLGRAVVRMVKPAGVQSFKLAIFEDHNFYQQALTDDTDSLIRGWFDDKWRPLLRVHSAKERYWTYVYVRESGKQLRLLIAGLEHNSAVVLRVTIDPDKLVKFIEQPEILGVKLGSNKQHNHSVPDQCTGVIAAPSGDGTTAPK